MSFSSLELLTRYISMDCVGGRGVDCFVDDDDGANACKRVESSRGS